MSLSNHERIGRLLNLVKQGVYPYFEREMKARYKDQWVSLLSSTIPPEKGFNRTVAEALQEDAAVLLKAMWELWNDVFKQTLGHAERSWLSELRDIRNRWAHHNPFSTDDTYRAFDTAARFLSAIAAPEADQLEKQKQELLRIRFDEQARRETRRSVSGPLNAQPIAGLKPWREIVTPHQDVASGGYQQAEFAADLWQVFLDKGSDEYRLPTEFFRRTYLTEGLTQLLTNALIRLSGQGGDPVIELQTNFGGGKTHAMLSLYHLFSGYKSQDLPGLEPVLTAAGITEPPPNVKIVVLVGNKISPGQIYRKKDGTEIRTLWGEIAYQLGGREGYEMIRQSDETATNPGDTLKLLFNRYAPCLILIDEWVSYARQLHDTADLPAGSFDTHFTFAQTLSESAKNAAQTLLVTSIPSSDIEIGGDRGREALVRLKNAIGRVESPWRPASAEESFEIVRRRLFQPITDQNAFISRDAVIKAFSQMYREHAAEFPSECREASYERRLKDAYPIHPEVFDRLYTDWSTLDKFQRTRGVLRLMAKVIHTLWERGDSSLMILPASIPMDNGQVQSELTRYLEDSWVPILEKDVDGANSLPVALDRQNPNLGRYSACRRVTRTIYLGSAPTLQAANKGIEDRRIKLGCAQPGESIATFGDALRRLTDQATYLYENSNRYWISTQPNVTRTAADRANQFLQDKDRIWAEIVKRLKDDRQRGEFTGIHLAPQSSADVPDDASMGVRLVILDPPYPHINKATDSPARIRAQEILNTRGSGPRYYKNLLLFLAADQSKLINLEQSVAQFLAWKSILDDQEGLNLDVFQRRQAESKHTQSNDVVNMQLQETYQWALVPTQPDPHGPVEWTEIRLQGQESPILRASRKLVHESYLVTTYAASLLRMEALDQYLWRESNHLSLKKLWEYLASYLYLPRLKNSEVLIQAVQEGVSALLWQEYFAYASGWDETKQRYLGLKAGPSEPITVTLSDQSLLVKPAIALQQFALDQAAVVPLTKTQVDSGTTPDPIPPTPNPDPLPPPVKKICRFHSTVKLDPMRLNRDAGQIANEVLQHLNSLVEAEVEVILEIQARIPDGVPENVIRTVTENCRTLRFSNFAFEAE